MQTPRSVGGFIRRSEHRCGSHGEPRSDGEPGLKLAKRIPATAMCHVIGVLQRMKLRLVHWLRCKPAMGPADSRRRPREVGSGAVALIRAHGVSPVPASHVPSGARRAVRPTPDEIAWAQELTRSSAHVLALVVALSLQSPSTKESSEWFP